MGRRTRRQRRNNGALDGLHASRVAFKGGMTIRIIIWQIVHISIVYLLYIPPRFGTCLVGICLPSLHFAAGVGNKRGDS